jgi:hypothetical protein
MFAWFAWTGLAFKAFDVQGLAAWGRSQDGNTFGSGQVWNFADEFQDKEPNVNR